MANSLTIQVLQDGPRNTTLKVEGVLDTSDLAATGQIGASGFTTTAGSNTIAFVAGALAPVIGQYLTFSDGTATFAAGTYVTGIVDATHITVNNLAKITNAAAAVTITGSAGAVVIADPALLCGIDNTGLVKAANLAIADITNNIEDLLACNLFWDATVPQRIESLVGRGRIKYYEAYGVTNNAGAGRNGRLTLSTQGWTTGATLSFSLLLKLRKQQT